MMLKEETTPPSEALPVAALRGYLRLGSGFDGADDAAEVAALAGMLRAAMKAIEARMGKALLTRRYQMRLDDWRDRLRQTLPMAPVLSVEAVGIEDADGRLTPLPEESWRLVPDDQRPAIIPTGVCLPHVPRLGTVVVRFNAGFGPHWDDVPADLAQAVLMLAAQYYEDRGCSVGANAMPFGVAALIERWRSVRLLCGRRGVVR